LFILDVTFLLAGISLKHPLLPSTLKCTGITYRYLELSDWVLQDAIRSAREDNEWESGGIDMEVNNNGSVKSGELRITSSMYRTQVDAQKTNTENHHLIQPISGTILRTTAKASSIPIQDYNFTKKTFNNSSNNNDEDDDDDDNSMSSNYHNVEDDDGEDIAEEMNAATTTLLRQTIDSYHEEG
jgi:hypothetical protein